MNSAKDPNQTLAIKMITIILAGAALGAPAVGLWLYECNELSFNSAAGSKYYVPAPPITAYHAKDSAFYCADGVNKKYLGCQ